MQDVPLLLDPLTDREVDVLRLMAEGLSNAEIADRLIIGLETVRWHTKQIYSKLGVHSRTQASLRARDLGLLDEDSPPPVRSAPLSPRHNLPVYTTPFVGREYECAEIAAMLTDPAVRLITIAGPGGMGKTRLCVEIARMQAARFAGGVVFVPLLSSLDDLETALAHHLGLRLTDRVNPREQVLHHLRGQQRLIVLDNFERMPDGVDAVAAILDAAPDVKMLVTSHLSLNLREEWVRAIDTLSVPPDADVPDLEQYGAVRLFYERVRRVRHDFSLDDHRESVVDICQMVQGVPLAVELAAAWLKTLTCEDVAREIRHNIDFLATSQRDVEERHRSMEAVFEYGWKLLTDDEQRVFRRLSVFRGGFGRAAAEQVAGASIRALSELVGKSLLAQNAAGLYEIHDLLRQYAERKLENLDVTQRSMRSNKLLAWSSLLKGSFDKLEQMAQSLLRVTSDTSDGGDKAFALAALGVLAGLHEDFPRCQQLCEAAQPLVKKDDPITFIFAHFGLALAASHFEDYPAAKRHLRAALGQAAALRNPALSLLCLPVAAILLAHEVEAERAVELLALSLTHPASVLGWLDQWPLVGHLRADLLAELGESEYRAAWERGKALDLERACADLLAAW